MNQYQWLGVQCEIPTGSIRTEIIKLSVSVSGFMVKEKEGERERKKEEGKERERKREGGRKEEREKKKQHIQVIQSKNLLLCFLQVLSSRYYYISIMW